jgi:uncharacterized linocin/CFP29 family protein
MHNRNQQLASVMDFQTWLNEGGKNAAQMMRPVYGVHQNALLRRYEWEEIDTAVVDVARTTLVAAADFQRLGLIQPLGGLGTTVSVYEQLGDMTDAEVSMEGITRVQQDQPDYTPQSVPVPIIHKDFSFTARHLAASRKLGDSIDTTAAQTAARRVRDKIESMIFNGDSLSMKGYAIQGFTTKTERIQKTATECGGGDFGTEGNSYASIVGGIGFLAAAGFTGPYGVYVARTQYHQMLNRLTDGSSLSEYQAILNGVPEVSYIRAADALTAASVVIWQLSRDVADLAVAQDFVTLQWDMQGGMKTEFKVMTALVPRIKHDANGACGVLHMTGA